VVDAGGKYARPVRFRPIRLVAAALAVALLAAFGGTEERPPLRVLFVGNSLTAWNDLPSYRRSALTDVIASYRNAAAAAGAVLLPAGQAWRAAWRRNPKLKLHGPDGFHPSATGTYLAALTVFAGLTSTSPVGLPRVVATTSARVALTPKMAKTLQLSAAEALKAR
jgi:hypothetical protein